ncbi:MAG: hypothetical protein FWC55_07675 [Firmicutes bacterium]|nr:hypothetical protein [Bacillota bacterium]
MDDHNGPGRSDAPVSLCTVRDGSEAAVLMALLESCGIPSMKKYKGIGDSVALYMGIRQSGGNVEILVPPELLEAAREALAAEPAASQIEEETEAGEEETDAEPEVGLNRRRTLGWVLAAVMVLPVAAAIVAMIVRLVSRI